MTNNEALLQIQSIPEKIWNQLSDADNEALGMAYQALVKQTGKQSVRINLNESVKVKLTDAGKSVYYHCFDDFNKRYGREVIKPDMPSRDEEGYTKFQLWKFMMIFGNYIDVLLEPVGKPLEIVYEWEDKNDEQRNHITSQ